MPPAGDPVHKGTLVCVVLKAKNLPNKRSIGKQDPYCVLAMGSEQQKTKPDKRGGQHPTWDEQLHFEVYEDMEDALAKRTGDAAPSGSGSNSNSSSVSKATGSAARSKGGKKVLKVSCYADDSKDPEFIGEGLVDLTDTLKTGEFDEWVPIKAKDRYAGEVYLELTFYSAAAPPKRKKAIKPVVSGNDTYGGAGTFQDIDDLGEPPAAPPKPSASSSSSAAGAADIPASMRPGGGHRSQMSGSMSVSNLSSLRPSSGMAHSATMSDIPSSLRPSSSLAQIDAYTPPYAPASIGRGSSPAPPPAPQHSGDGAGEFGQQPSHLPRRNSFVANGSEYGGGMVPSASYYGHSAAPSQATIVPSSYGGGGGGGVALDRYGTMSSMASTSSLSSYAQQLPASATMSHLSSYSGRQDPAEQLSHSMSAMSFHQHQPPHQQPPHHHHLPTAAGAGTGDKPLPPPTPTPASNATPPSSALPPQSHIYQHHPQMSSGYQAQPPPPQPQHSYTPQPTHAHLGPTPPPHPASAPPTHGEYGQGLSGGPPPPAGGSHYYGGGGGGGGYDEPARPVSPAASTYSSVAPSVINAQAYYQQPTAGGSGGLHPQHQPPRASSPALSSSASMAMPVASPYQAPYGSVAMGADGSLPPMRRAPRPLPSTQPMMHQSPAAATATPPPLAPSPANGGVGGGSAVYGGQAPSVVYQHQHQHHGAAAGPGSASATTPSAPYAPPWAHQAAPPPGPPSHHYPPSSAPPSAPAPAPTTAPQWTQQQPSYLQGHPHQHPPPPPQQYDAGPPTSSYPYQHHGAGSGMSSTSSYPSHLYAHYSAAAPPS
ncbi:uncharacterized protein PFL1_04818 [Pseudozyma flocculosa PF-1]|uniref:C2 domain-containing protein n=2 Tax=Pseudozyma flocculosa TaxID=84751 RepID=A0A5C3F690_9BASI|nr:uncharacterized protein PFL1_04818 [Pseudozyma flocculosa PF-1]EPQ27680.1 hypothetical protein PFL1_04818 [Pseudozyma flocculosa PF-1]SPO39187.1 uncharacterized protein PSFLO_04666 [Pseudozyma flocculosa]